MPGSATEAENQLAQQWSQMLQYQMQGKAGAMPFTGGVPFPNVPFMQPFMYPNAMMYNPALSGMNPYTAAFMASMAEGADPAKATLTSTTAEAKDDAAAAAAAPSGPGEGGSAEEGSRKREADASEAADAPSKRAALAPGQAGDSAAALPPGVKTGSQAALSLLASAAATGKPGSKVPGLAALPGLAGLNMPPMPPGAMGLVPGAATGASVAASSPGAQHLAEVWNALNGQFSQSPALPELKRTGSAEALEAELAAAAGDERELKRLRRKQSNRDSARRSRLRKQAECEELGKRVKDLIAENGELRAERIALRAQIEVLDAKLAMSSAFNLALGAGELEKIQADARAKQAAEATNVAAAIAQVNALTANSNAADQEDEEGEDRGRGGPPSVPTPASGPQLPPAAAASGAQAQGHAAAAGALGPQSTSA